MTYKIKLSIDMASVFPPVDDLVNKMNNALTECGCSEKLIVRAKMFALTLTSGHELTSDERQKVKNTLIDEFNTKYPAWKVKVESFRRQSGNVQQSVIQ